MEDPDSWEVGGGLKIVPVFFWCPAADSPKPARTRPICAAANMGGRSTREIHHHHEDKESKEMARKANEEMAAIRSQMAEQERRNQQNLERHQEALRRAEQLRAEERDAYVQRLQAEQEERRRESERAREQLEQQEREAEQLRDAVACASAFATANWAETLLTSRDRFWKDFGSERDNFCSSKRK